MGKSYSAPLLSPEKAQAVERGDFDYLLPFAKNFWRTDEVAKAIGRSTEYVRLLIEEGRLEAHQDRALAGIWRDRSGDRREEKSPIRTTSLVTRRSLILYLAETANYDPAYFVLRIEALFPKLSPETLDRLIASATAQRNRIQ